MQSAVRHNYDRQKVNPVLVSPGRAVGRVGVELSILFVRADRWGTTVHAGRALVRGTWNAALHEPRPQASSRFLSSLKSAFPDIVIS